MFSKYDFSLPSPPCEVTSSTIVPNIALVHCLNSSRPAGPRSQRSLESLVKPEMSASIQYPGKVKVQDEMLTRSFVIKYEIILGQNEARVSLAEASLVSGVSSLV